MATIGLSKDVLKFLQSAILPEKDLKGHNPALGYVMASDQGKIITTDGWRVHVYIYKNLYTPGFYMVNKSGGNLIQVDDESVGRPGYYNDVLSIYPNWLDCSTGKPEMYMYAADRGTLDLTMLDRWDRYPKISETGHSITFRPVTLKSGEKVALSQGINALPFEFDEEGRVSLEDRADSVTIDAKFIQDCLACGEIAPVLRWGLNTGAAILGRTDGCHAVLMPKIISRKRSY